MLTLIDVDKNLGNDITDEAGVIEAPVLVSQIGQRFGFVEDLEIGRDDTRDQAAAWNLNAENGLQT